MVAEARQFPFRIGLEEEPVTGVAMGDLAAWLVEKGGFPLTELVIEQNHATGRPRWAELVVQIKNTKVHPLQLRGRAVEIRD